MSASRLNLKSPPVLAGMGLMLIVVVVINLRTFGVSLPGRGQKHVVRQQRPPVPAELQLASESMFEDRLLPMPSPALNKPVLRRDPFLATILSGAPAQTQSGRAKTAKGAKPRSQKSRLTCSAILLGGKRPTALIDGEALGPGDLVRGYRIVEITATEVLLKKSTGQALTLWVAPDNKDQGTFKVVTGVQPADHGTTRLVDHR